MIENTYIKDISLFSKYLSLFFYFVKDQDKQKGYSSDDVISFSDSNCFLGVEEGYKSGIAEEAKKELRLKDWKESWIGTDKISKDVINAIDKASNLVDYHQKNYLKNRLNRSHIDFDENAERVLFEIYRGNDEEKAFKMAINTFGARYDLISFLFLIKDSERFLPISPTNFDKSFETLGIDFKTSHNCCWENYNTFIAIMREIQFLLNNSISLKSEARLIDAHSFMWVLHEDKFMNWLPSEEETIIIEDLSEKLLQKFNSGEISKKEYTVHKYQRSLEVAKKAKKRANGICELCRNTAPFDDKNGEPYLESHHIEWLSKGGRDDVEFLKNRIKLMLN